jgi:hypothetical protein
MPSTSRRIPKWIRDYQKAENERIARVKQFTHQVNEDLDRLSQQGKPTTN